MEAEGLFEGIRFYGAIGMNLIKQPLSNEAPRQIPLTGYHVLMTAPFFCTHPDKSFIMSEFYLSTIKLSALAWRRYNGSIYLLTDAEGADYFERKGFRNIYNDILPILDSDMYGLDNRRYWAAGKIQALRKIKAPFVLIDLDLIVWRVLDVSNCDIAAAHTEPLFEDIYPPFEFFDMSPQYNFPAEWDEHALPLNTSIAYFSEDNFKEYYAKAAIRFMQYERNSANSDGIRCMVFAEQRILGMCAVAKNQIVKTYLDYDKKLAKQNLITHLWSCKSFLRCAPDVAREYIHLCEDKSARLQGELEF